MTVILDIPDVPEDVHAALREEARRRGISLQSYLLQVIETEAYRHRETVLRARSGEGDAGDGAGGGAYGGEPV